MELHSSQKQTGGMVKAVAQLLESAPAKAILEPLQKWIVATDFAEGKSVICPIPLLDPIFALLKEVPLEKRLPIVDLLRIIVLHDKKVCMEILSKHFDDIQDLLVSPTSAEVEKGGKKILFLYAYILKMFGNCFAHPEAGQLLLTSSNYYALTVYMLTTGFELKDATVVYAAAVLAHNMIQAASDKTIFEAERATLLQGLVRAMNLPGVDDATLYWIAYASAVALYEAKKEEVLELKRNADLNSKLTTMEGSQNKNVKSIAGDLKMMLGVW